MCPPRRARRAFVLVGLALAACGSSPAAGAHLDSGVTGRVLLGPTCPVQRPGKTCVRGYRATIAIYTARTHRLVRTFRSATDGRFRVHVAPGRYSLRGQGTGLPRARPVAVTVKRHRFTTVTVHFDSGIR